MRIPAGPKGHYAQATWRGRSELTNLILTADRVAELVERMLRTSGRRIDLSTPFVDSVLPDGSRLMSALTGD